MFSNKYKIKFFLYCFFNNIKRKSSILGLVLAIGNFIAEILIVEWANTIENIFRFSATVFSIGIVLVVLIWALYESFINLEDSNVLFLIHESPIILFSAELKFIFKKFPIREEIRINTANFSNDDHIQWEYGEKEQERVFKEEIKNNITKIDSLHYIGIAEIPFVIHLGYLIGDSISVRYYQRQRNSFSNVSPWEWPAKGELNDWKIKPVGLSKNVKGKNILLLIEQSYKIEKDELPLNDISNHEIIKISTNIQSINDLKSEWQLKIIRTEIKKTLDTIKEANSIHIFASVPTPTAFAIGQSISQSAHPE